MQKGSGKKVFFSYALFILGLFVASMGVAFSAKAGLGTPPVAFSLYFG